MTPTPQGSIDPFPVDHSVTRLSFAEALEPDSFRRIAEYPKLRELYLHNQWGFSDVALEGLSSLSHLEILSLQGTAISKRSLGILLGFAHLKELALLSPNLDPNRLEGLCQLPALTVLDLSGSDLTDQGISILLGCRKLERLRLSRTQVTVKGLLRLRALPSLRRVEVAGISLGGEDLDALHRALPNTEIYYPDQYKSPK